MDILKTSDEPHRILMNGDIRNYYDTSELAPAAIYVVVLSSYPSNQALFFYYIAHQL